MTEAGASAEVERLRAELESCRTELEACRQFLAQVMDAEDQARLRIAELIHDDALQTLLAANQELHEAAPGRAGVTRAHEVVSQSIADLREALLALHPVTLQQGGLEIALGAVARQAERQGGLAVDVDLHPDAIGVNDELVLAVARELLGNAAKHSGASTATVAVRAVAGRVELEVADDGRGIQPGRRESALAEGHIGLASVAQRLEANGGSFRVSAKPGEGTRVWAGIRSV